MGRKGKKIKSSGEGGIVYSTNSNFGFGDLLANALGNEPDSEKDILEVHFEKKGRSGKTAVVIKGFSGSEEELKTLGKTLKTKCGVGGSVKDGEIIIQGNVREKVMEVLEAEGFKTKRVGG
jgi:translation initiation factor 1